MSARTRFAVYNHHFVLNDGQRIVRKFIVLKHPTGVLQFTNFHEYITTSSSIKRLASDGNSRYDFVVKLLNYVYFDVGCGSFNKVTIEIISDFLNKYGLCKLPGDNENTTRTKDTVQRCIQAVIEFIELYIEKNANKCAIKKSDLFKKVNKRDKRGKVVSVKQPVFDVTYKGNVRTPIFRDIPNKCFNILFSYIATYHKEILGLIMHSAFGGLRPAESCNVRNVNSPLGPGIHFWQVEGEIYKIEIDLKKELKLRTDDVNVGNIKKERIQLIPDIFQEAYIFAYNIYTEYMKTQKADDIYGAFNLNKQGHAITYASYFERFRKIIKTELIPIFLSHNDPEVVMYGRILIEHNLSPHVFRHWYTVQLVLSGVDNPGTLMNLRGDTNPTSSLRYLADKSELAKKYARVTNEIFDYMKWMSKEQHEHG